MQSLSISLASFFIFFITIFLYLLFYKRKSKNLPPGKTCFPVVGESLEFLSAGWKGNPEKFILERISKYSSNVFRTHLFGSPVVAFCGASANKFLFSNENKLVQAWYPKPFDKIFPSSTEHKSSSKEESIRLRKLLPHFLKPEGLQRVIGTMDEIAQRHFAMDWENKEQVVVYQLTKRFTFSLGCRLFVSIEDESEIDKYSGPFAVLTAGLISIPLDFPLTPFRRALKAAKYLRGELMEIIKRRKVDLVEGRSLATQDVLSYMLTYSDENGKCLTDSSIVDKILGLLLGGHDTSSSACASVVKFLAELPEVYQRVYEEQMEIARSKAPGELLNWDDIQKMRYSWNVVCEVLRLAPPLQGAFRETLTDFTYKGFSIPKGWKIYWSVNSTHKNPEIYPDPDKFDPSRFEGSGPSPYTFVPFGGGPRMCPGREYARLEILVFVHHLVRKFKWEKVFADEKIVYDPLPNPEKGLPIRLFPH